MSFLERKKAFTLVELLVVIGVIGILATIVIISYGNAQSKSRDSKRMADLDSIASALELYKYDSSTKSYPVIPVSVTSKGTCWTNIDIIDVNGSSGLANVPTFSTFLPKMPSDPKPDTTNQATTNYCAIRNYIYGSTWSAFPTYSYRIEVAMENDHGAKVNNLAYVAKDPTGKYIYGYGGAVK